jgi:hypothetical protein
MDPASRVKLYREQAEVCARAARTTPESGLRDAYLGLERGWLRLAEELEREEERRRASGE